MGNSSQFNFRLDLLGFSGLILGLAVGYGVGLVFKYLSKQTNKKAEHGQELLARSFKKSITIDRSPIICGGLQYFIRPFVQISDF